jgi:hypothetical protein
MAFACRTLSRKARDPAAQTARQTSLGEKIRLTFQQG